jgi:hypothetical protein
VRDLEQNLAINKEILNKLLSNNQDVNHSLMGMIKDQQLKNTSLVQQVETLKSEKESMQTFAN